MKARCAVLDEAMAPCDAQRFDSIRCDVMRCDAMWCDGTGWDGVGYLKRQVGM